MNKKDNHSSQNSKEPSSTLSLIITAIVMALLIIAYVAYFPPSSKEEVKEETHEQTDEVVEEDIIAEEPVGKDETEMPGEFSEQKLSSKKAKDIISEKAEEVIQALKNKDFVKLATYVHPDKGVRFSPYATVDKTNDQIFLAPQIEDLKHGKVTYTWGTYDGSGEPIVSSYKDYHNEFVYEEDFANAGLIGYNEILVRGNSINNAFDVYPGSIIVEYHFPEIDPQYEGMDWRSLRLVFKEKDGAWYLVGIIHDQWTI